jgi:hypothetical protein
MAERSPLATRRCNGGDREAAYRKRFGPPLSWRPGGYVEYWSPCFRTASRDMPKRWLIS